MPRHPNSAPTAVYLAAIGLSSFTLFSLELLAARLVLPVFGGTPYVWTTALCLFTTAVFLGYLYAHAVATRLSARAGALLHLLPAIGTAVVAYLFRYDVALMRIGGDSPVIEVLFALVLVAGAPALLLSTTTPLLSAWYARTGRSPWWLYAVSNAASLAALLAYPLVVEPLVPLSVQRSALVVALTLLAGLLAWVASEQVWRPPLEARGEAAAVADAARTVAEIAAAGGAPSLRRQSLWLAASVVPAGLLPAISLYLSTDYVSSPLLWVGPLAVFLGSFIVVFSDRGRPVVRLAERALPVALGLLWLPFVLKLSWPVPVLLTLMLGSFAVVATVIHGRLALDRPGPAYLTRFYLVLSAGGMVATGLVALAAPVVFGDVYEYPLLLVGAVAVLAVLPSAVRRDATVPVGTRSRWTGRRLAPFGVALAATSAVLLVAFAPPHLERVRTFFGITEVRASRGGSAVEEIHGTTLHGVQFTDERRSEPTAYFIETGPLGDVMGVTARRRPDGADLGVVGLGVGTIASYGRPTDRLTYFEVDQAVVDLARDPRYFTYLADSSSRLAVVLGDGRLSLARESRGSFDLVILDAFSSDSVPVHLLTQEAIAEYQRTLRSDGLLVFQLTNRHFDLVPAVASTARSLGLDARTRSYTPRTAEKERLAAQPSRWLVVGSAESVADFDELGWDRPASGPVLTDDHADIMRLMIWR